jgi:hypothetical protein
MITFKTSPVYLFNCRFEKYRSPSFNLVIKLCHNGYYYYLLSVNLTVVAVVAVVAILVPLSWSLKLIAIHEAYHINSQIMLRNITAKQHQV